MISSAIWKKTCISEIFKDDRNSTSPKDECMFFQIAQENILLHINNMHENMIKNCIF